MLVIIFSVQCKDKDTKEQDYTVKTNRAIYSKIL